MLAASLRRGHLDGRSQGRGEPLPDNIPVCVVGERDQDAVDGSLPPEQTHRCRQVHDCDRAAEESCGAHVVEKTAYLERALTVGRDYAYGITQMQSPPCREGTRHDHGVGP